MFNDSAFFERTLRGRFREKSLVKVFEIAECSLLEEKTYVVFQEICLSNTLKQIKSRANYTVPGTNLTVEPWEVCSF